MSKPARSQIGNERSFFREPASDCPVTATILIPAYNAQATIERAIRSALAQTMTDIEVIVINDCSSDSSEAIITKLQSEDRRLRLINNAVNIGKAAGMNHGVAIARGRWTAVLDADDWYEPCRLERLIAIAEHENADMVADNQVLFDQGAETSVGTGWPVGERRSSYWELTMDDFIQGSNVYDNFNLGMLKPVVKTEFVRAAGVSYEEQARFGEDFLYLLSFFMSRGRAYICDEPLYFYTQPYGSLSRQWSHAGRARYDFRQAIDFTKKYMTQGREAFTPAQVRFLEGRCRQLASIDNFFVVREGWKVYPFQGLAGLIGPRLSMLDYVFHRALTRTLPAYGEPVASKIARRSRSR